MEKSPDRKKLRVNADESEESDGKSVPDAEPEEPRAAPWEFAKEAFGILLTVPELLPYATAAVENVTHTPHVSASEKHPHVKLQGVDVVRFALKGTSRCPRTHIDNPSCKPVVTILGHFASFLCCTNGANEECDAFVSKPFAVPMSLEEKLRRYPGATMWTDHCLVPRSVGGRDCVNDAFATEEFVRLRGNRLILDGVVWAYDGAGKWSHDSELIERMITECGDGLTFVLEPDEGQKTKPLVKSFQNAAAHKAILQFLPSKLPDNADYMISEGREDSAVDYLLFKNGVYSFEEGTFFKGFGICKKRNLFFLSRVPHEFPTLCDDALTRELNRMVYIEPFAQTHVGNVCDSDACGQSHILIGDELRHRYGGDECHDPEECEETHYCENGDILRRQHMHAICMHWRRKQGVMGTGPPNSFKSSQHDLFVSVFGKELVGTFQLNNLMTGAGKGMEEARRKAWMLTSCLGKRMVFSNEGDVGKDCNIQSTTLKSWLSGGDVQEGRLIHKYTLHYKNQATPFIFSNDPIPLSPPDEATQKRLVVVETKYSFVSDPLAPTSSSVPRKKGNPNLKTELQDAKWRGPLLRLMRHEFNAWKDAGKIDPTPSETNADLRNDTVPVVNVRDILEEAYAFTTVTTDWTLSDEVLAYVQGRLPEGLRPASAVAEVVGKSRMNKTWYEGTTLVTHKKGRRCFNGLKPLGAAGQFNP